MSNNEHLKIDFCNKSIAFRHQGQDLHIVSNLASYNKSCNPVSSYLIFTVDLLLIDSKYSCGTGMNCNVHYACLNSTFVDCKSLEDQMFVKLRNLHTCFLKNFLMVYLLRKV